VAVDAKMVAIAVVKQIVTYCQVAYFLAELHIKWPPQALSALDYLGRYSAPSLQLASVDCAISIAVVKQIVSFLMIWLGFLVMKNRNGNECAGTAEVERHTPQQGNTISNGRWRGTISSRRAFMLGTALLSFCGGSEGGAFCPAGYW
jgi:hypothetical protein